MAKKDSRVDDYIARSAEFARPVLMHIRRLVHAACPQVEETIKWGSPFFVHEGILCYMAAFKRHCAFGFWPTALRDSLGDLPGGKEAMGQFGRITRIADLPKQALFKRLIMHAAGLSSSGARPPRAAAQKTKKPPTIKVPADLAAALKKNKRAKATFDRFSYTNKKEYVQWLTEAKREETRAKRLTTAIEWMAEGKGRNWKYS